MNENTPMPPTAPIRIGRSVKTDFLNSLVILLIAKIILSYAPVITAIVPPLTPGIILATPISIPLIMLIINFIIFFLSKVFHLILNPVNILVKYNIYLTKGGRDMKQSTVYEYLSVELRNIFEQKINISKIYEIRMRIGQPLMVNTGEGEFFVSIEGLTDSIGHAYIVKEQDLRETLEYISNYSLYAYEEELKNGFITIPGGNRIGVSGKAVLDNKGVTTIRNISFINIRLAQEFIGCSDDYINYFYEENELCHTLIVSPPCCGKTTFLRDMIRNISNGFGDKKGMIVGVVDERSEIAACYKGVPQNNVGIRTDVMDACPKAHGIIMMIRSMGPRVIAVDEIGKKEDVEAIEYSINCGCKIIATIHGASFLELKQKPVMETLINNKIFSRYVVMSNYPKMGTVKEIYNKEGQLIWNIPIK